MREIRFRGKRLDNGEWVYGGYHKFPLYGGVSIVTTKSTVVGTERLFIPVDPATVGQYTGLKDKQGREIYEGDRCKGLHDFGPGGFSEREFTVTWFPTVSSYRWEYWLLDSLEIIDPDLLEKL